VLYVDGNDGAKVAATSLDCFKIMLLKYKEMLMGGSGIPLGRLFGIRIFIDWSWFLIFLLVTMNLTFVFAQFHPEWGTFLNLVIAILTAILFFVSVLVHEFAHSLVAIAQGLPVRNITLFLFGGVANITREPPSPRAEFLITVVGPIASFVLGIICLLLAGVVGQLAGAAAGPQELLAQLGPLGTVLLLLGTINISLAIFNLIPGFPLDGGRILRSILWAMTGNLRRATRWASWVGQIVAWIFIVAGIAMLFGVRVPFFGTGLSGLWLAFIGWFLNNAAIQSYQQVAIRDMLEGVQVSRLLRPNVLTVEPNMPVSVLVHDHIMGTDDRAFPVVDNGRLVGIVTITDVRKAGRETWEQAVVQEIMTPADQLVVASPKQDASEALEKLVQRDISQMPVVDGQQVIGLLRRRDISRWMELQSERGV
jgi:Zn-dependent protease